MRSSRGNTTVFDRSTRSGRNPSSARRRSIRYSYSGESVARVVVGRELAFEVRVGDVEVEAVAERLQVDGVIFLIWCVALRASKPVPSVQPFTVLARITVGEPSCSTAALYAA